MIRAITILFVALVVFHWLTAGAEQITHPDPTIPTQEVTP